MVESILSNFEFLAGIPKILGLIIILAVGFGFAKLFEILIRKATKREKIAKYFSYAIIIGVLIYGLFYFNPSILNLFVVELSKNANLLIDILFVVIIGIILVNVIVWVIDWTIGFFKIKEYFGQIGLGSEFLFTIELFIKIILYLVIVEVVILMLNLKSTLINTVLLSIVIAAIALFTGLLFYGLKDFFVNWFDSLALKSSNLFKPGKRLRTDKFSGEIISINSTSTIIDNGKGEYVWIPNSKLASSEVFIQKSRFDLKILEELRKNFEKFSLTGGYVSMILDFIGVEHKSKKLMKFEEENWKKIIQFVKEFTKSEVSGMIIPYKSTIDLKREVKSWLLEGGFIIFRFFKPAIFPGIKKRKENLVLCVGIERDSLILIDLKNGVYLMNYKDMEDAIDKLEEKYFMVFARKGSNAYLRIKNKLYYSNPDYYEKLNKTAERKLKQIIRKMENVEIVYPQNVTEIINKYKK